MPPVDTPPQPPPLPAERTRWQFSLRTMLFGITGFAVLCGFFAVVPVFSGLVLGAIWLVLSGWLLTGLVFARGDAKAFCIGAAVVVASTWTGMGGQFLEAVQRFATAILPFDPYGPSPFLAGSTLMWFKHVVLLLAAAGNGYLCIHARRYFEQRQ